MVTINTTHQSMSTDHHVHPQALLTLPFDQPHTWLEISASALEHNIKIYRSIIGPHVQLASVIKSNAYGHGIKEISQLCQNNTDIDWLCATSLTEALFLRQTGITKPILVMSLINADPLLAIEHSIDLIAFDISTISMLNAFGAKVNKTVNVHIKIDTGLARYGLLPHETLEFIRHVASLPYINIRGIFSHFAESDSENGSYTYQQLELFNTIINSLAHHKINVPLKHISNSAAAITLSGNYGNFVRIGAGLYGLHPSAHTINHGREHHINFELKTVMTWKTRLQQIRTVPANSYVGYSRTYQTAHQTIIGIIPIGYFEGYDRRLSNKGKMIVRTKQGNEGFAPVIGRVCMNIIMLDITNIAGASVGDEVIVMGGYPSIHAHEIANSIESFNAREITTRINQTIARIITA
ncbi:MAG TPA: alanine racemase [Candidatus Babeliales bacterium]|nr:alanine racemase [Candidatus Babeliales bacterium]